MSSLAVSLDRYDDVVQALQCDILSSRSTLGEEHREFREIASAAANPAKLADWTPRVARAADLVSDVAKPWSLEIAAIVADISLLEAKRLSQCARDIFNAAAEPFDRSLQDNANQATVALAASFQGPLLSFQVQAFVALSQTLPCFLANAWLALLQRPEEMSNIPWPTAIDELLRFAGPSRAILRYATTDVRIGGVSIPKGATVALMLAAANRDADRFSDPDRLDLRRKRVKHLAFGLGSHACLGGSLIRTAAIVATRAFVDHFADAKIVNYSEDERFAIRSLKSLQVK